MGSISWVHWVVVLISASAAIPIWTILKRLGLSPFWTALYFIPFFGLIVGLWMLSSADWPAVDRQAQPMNF